MSLFLEGLFDSNSWSKLPPSAIKMFFPVLNQQNGSTQGFETIQGLLTSEVTLSSQIKWGSILNDVSNLQAVASLLGQQKMWSWIGASTMCWYGTEPIKTGFDFYLINYKRGLGLEDKLTKLNYLTSLLKAGNASVYVHGGYAPPVLETNNSAFDNGEQSSVSKATLVEKILEPFNSQDLYDYSQGTVSIIIGNKIKLSKMLVQRLDVTPSVVEVPDGLPLYYKVSVSLTGHQPLLSTQVSNMYRKF